MSKSTGTATTSCLKKKTVQRYVQRHVFAQSPPGRRPNDKYPVNTSHSSDLCKNVSLRCYLVATVIHILFFYAVRYVCISTYSSQCRDAGLAIVGVGGVNWDSPNAACHRFASPKHMTFENRTSTVALITNT